MLATWKLPGQEVRHLSLQHFRLGVQPEPLTRPRRSENRCLPIRPLAPARCG